MRSPDSRWTRCGWRRRATASSETRSGPTPIGAHPRFPAVRRAPLVSTARPREKRNGIRPPHGVPCDEAHVHVPCGTPRLASPLTASSPAWPARDTTRHGGGLGIGWDRRRHGRTRPRLRLSIRLGRHGRPAASAIPERATNGRDVPRQRRRPLGRTAGLPLALAMGYGRAGPSSRRFGSALGSGTAEAFTHRSAREAPLRAPVSHARARSRSLLRRTRAAAPAEPIASAGASDH